MKYLQPSFTIYPAVPKRSWLRDLDHGKVKPIDPNHEYTEVGGMCLHCALDRKGHNSKYGGNQK